MQIPPVNETRFLPLPVDLSNLYNYYQFDRQFDYLSRLWFQQKRFYKQRKQVDDFNCIQVQTNLSSVSLEIRDRTNAIIATVAPTTTAFISGNNYLGNSLQTIQWVFKLQDVLPGFTGSCYYVIKGDTPVFSVTEYYPSESIWVKEKWEDTLLINYTHNRNDYNIIFSLRPPFSIRVDGYIIFDGTDSLDTEFEDQNNSNEVLYTYLQRKFRVEMGGYVGLPRYLIDKLNHIFGCKFIKIEDFVYTKDNGAKIEWENNDTAAAFNCSLVLQEADPTASYSFISERTIQLLPASGFPYAVLDLALVPPDNIFVYLIESTVNPQVIEDLTYLTTQVAAWNAAAGGLGLGGTFDIVDGFAVYLPASNEVFDPYSNVINTFFTVDERQTAANADLTWSILNFNDLLIDWTDSIEIITATSTLQVITHNFGNALFPGTANVRVFHRNDIINFQSQTSADTAKLINITGQMSTQLVTLVLKFVSNFTTTLDLSFLTYARKELVQLVVTDTVRDTITNPFGLSVDFNENFNKLALINLQDNLLTTGTIEDFVVDFVQLCNYLKGGVFAMALQGQTPPAPPTVPTATAISDLTAVGWVVTSD